MPTQTLVIRVDFQALTDLVAFLRDNQQQKVDAITAFVGSTTDRLKKANDNLQDAIVK